MPALMRQIALVSESELIPAGDVPKVAAAIQKQAARDLAPRVRTKVMQSGCGAL